MTTKVKGGSFAGTFTAARERLGEARFRDMLAMLPPDFREKNEHNAIMSNVWYPIEWERSLIGAYREMSGGSLSEVEKLGYRGAMLSFNGIYRILFRLLKPQTLLAKAGRIFAQFYSEASFELLEAREGFARTRFVAPGFDANIWATVVGSCRAALEVCGARDVNVQIESGGNNGDDEMVIAGTWWV